MSVNELVAYHVAQYIGAVFGSLLLWGSISSLTSDCDEDLSPTPAVCIVSVRDDGDGYGPPFGLGVNSLAPRVKDGSAFLIELIGTYLLLFVVFMSAVHNKSAAGNAAPIAIGWAVMLAHIVMVSPSCSCSSFDWHVARKKILRGDEGTVPTLPFLSNILLT